MTTGWPDCPVAAKSDSMNKIHPKNREYMVFPFTDNNELEDDLNAFAPAGWAIEKIHFNWFWRGGRLILWRKRRNT
jgi:hypothetical protein